MRDRFLLLTLGVLLGPARPAQADLSIDVSPVRFELQAEPGSEYTDAVRVQNIGSEALRLRAYVEDWHLDEEGTPLFEPAGTTKASACPWIALAPADFLIGPGQTQHVRFTLQVPANAPTQGHRAALLLESIPLNRADPRGHRMLVRGRVASMIYITVGTPTPLAEITSLSLIAREGRPHLRLRVHNAGEAHFRLSGTVDCLFAGTALGAPIRLPDVPILPGASRWVSVELPEDRVLANSLARVTVDLAGYGQLVGECPLGPVQADSKR